MRSNIKGAIQFRSVEAVLGPVAEGLTFPRDIGLFLRSCSTIPLAVAGFVT